MLEHIVQMGPMLVLAGLAAGLVAEAVSRAGGYGFLYDVALGLVGSAVGGGIFWTVISTSGVGLIKKPTDRSSGVRARGQRDALTERRPRSVIRPGPVFLLLNRDWRL